MIDCKSCINCENIKLITGESYLFCHESNAEVNNIVFKNNKCDCYISTEEAMDYAHHAVTGE